MVNLKNLKFFNKSVKKLFANLLKQTKMFTKPLPRALGYMLIKSFFPAIGWTYLHAFLKILKLLWGEIAYRKPFVFYGRTSRLTILYRICM